MGFIIWRWETICQLLLRSQKEERHAVASSLPVGSSLLQRRSRHASALSLVALRVEPERRGLSAVPATWAQAS